MKIDTDYFGEVEITNNEIIHFNQGIPGFENEQQFVLLNIEQNPVFQVMQSVKDKYVAFIVTSPYVFVKDYSFDLSDSTVEQLEITSDKDVIVLSIVTLKDSLANSTMNLKAPIIINQKKKLGRQFIIESNQFSKQTPISIHESGVR